MKKILTFITVLIMMLTLVACSITDNGNIEINNLSEVLNIEISQESIVEKKDTENGFMSLKITDTKTVEEIKSEWKELPLTENLTALVYGLEEEYPEQNEQYDDIGNCLKNAPEFKFKHYLPSLCEFDTAYLLPRIKIIRSAITKP